MRLRAEGGLKKHNHKETTRYLIHTTFKVVGDTGLRVYSTYMCIQERSILLLSSSDIL